MCIDESASLETRPICRVQSAPHAAFLVVSLLGLILLITGLAGCSGSASQEGGGTGGPDASAPNGMPELTDEIIHERINETRVWEVPEENGAADPIVWNFDHDEPKDIRVVERQQDGTRATIVLDITTSSSPGSRNPRHLSGQIRTEWELQTGWVLRRWEITSTENISMKYKNLPKPPAQNSNSNN